MEEQDFTAVMSCDGLSDRKLSSQDNFDLIITDIILPKMDGIDYFKFGQAIEASITNIGFLLLFGLQVHRNVTQLRIEYGKLLESEQRLRSWNADLQDEVNKRTKELEKINEQKTNNFFNLVHETKTPLTLIKNYLDEYISKYGSVQELDVVKGGVDKLTADVTNLFDIERFTKGIDAYKHNRISDFSAILSDSPPLFQHYCYMRQITCFVDIEDELLIKTDPNAINRIVNNIIENAIKFTSEGGQIVISLTKTVVGTTVTIMLPQHTLGGNEEITKSSTGIIKLNYEYSYYTITDSIFKAGRRTLLLIEDNITMLNFLLQKLSIVYNVFYARNDAEALKKLHEITVIPDLILSDVMMDKMDGFAFAEKLAEQGRYSHIPLIFLTAKFTQVDKLKGLKLGAMDFISKPFSFEELSQKIEPVLNNISKQQKVILSTSIAYLQTLKNAEQDGALNSDLSKFEKNCKLLHFTAREIEITRLIVKGRTYKMIAKELFISEKTVTKHIQNIFEKAEVRNKIQLINKLNK